MAQRFWMMLGCAALVLAVLPAGHAQQPGDVYMWEFNEGGGDTVTDNSGAFPAQVGLPLDSTQAPASSPDSPSGAAGDRSVVVNGGLTVDDTDGPVLAIQDGPITMEAWIRLQGLNATNGILAYGASYKMGINNGMFVWTFYGVEDVDSGVPIEADDTWHHVAMAWEPGVGVHFYLDGQLAGTTETANTGRAPQNSLLNIGSETAGGSPLAGQIDRARIHHALLDVAQLDSDRAAPKAPMATTVVAYDFNEAQLPFANGTAAVRPAVSTAELNASTTRPAFVLDSPKGTAGDYSLYFDGNDRVIFVDDKDILQFIDESVTFETWLKIDGTQPSNRAILFAYGVGGANGYSFSFRDNGAKPAADPDSPSGQAGDYSVKANKGLIVDDSVNPVLAIQDGPMTLEAWIKLESLNQTNDILSYGDTYKIGINNGVFVYTFRDVEDVLSGVAATADNQWHHIAMAWEPGVGVTFYLDGAQAAFVETASAHRELQSNILYLGTGAGGSVLPGWIDRVRIHHAVLTADQLDSDAAHPKAPLSSTLASYPFDEGRLPYQNQAGANLPADNTLGRFTMTVTTYGILDAHSTAEIPNDGQWHHVAAVHDVFQEFRFYVDGRLKETMAYDGGVRFADVYEFLIGHEQGGGNPYKGFMDRVKITRGVLTETALDYFEPAAVEQWPLF
ncbi:MAG: LamG-like jellyroll fold domain-containing protein [bacterium]